ncbi:MAG: hypothetical protein JJT76_04940 [Clostridiaceae bacterium]|nr:hypothetical protein [Clostridiaceae bacterium]
MNYIINPTITPQFVGLIKYSKKTRARNLYSCPARLYPPEVILEKSIDIRTTFAETQESITLNPDTLKKIQQTAIEDIKSKLKELFDLYQDKAIDIFDLEDIFKMKYPRVNIPNVIEVAKLHVDINVDINIDIVGGSDHTSFR